MSSGTGQRKPLRSYLLIVVLIGVFVLIGYRLGFRDGTKFGKSISPPPEVLVEPKPGTGAGNSGPANGEIDDHFQAHISHLRGLAKIIQKHADVNFDEKEFFRGSLDGALKALDQYGGIEKKPETAQTPAIGIRFIMRNGRFFVIELLPDSPASRGGIWAGDEIVEVNGIATLTLREAGELVGLIRQHSPVTLKLRRGENLLSVQLPLEQVEWPNIKDDLFEFGKIGYVRIVAFDDFDLDEELASCLDEQLRGGMQGLVLDLRGNPGGFKVLEQQVASLFLSPGQPISYELFRGEIKARLYAKEPPLFRGPIVVLINSSTASAAEMMAASLRGNDRAIIVGERSFGKTAATITNPILPITEAMLDGNNDTEALLEFLHENNLNIRYTTEHIRLPNIPDYEGKGLSPDFYVRSGDEVVLPGIITRDPQLRFALEALKKWLDQPELSPDEIKKLISEELPRK